MNMSTISYYMHMWWMIHDNTSLSVLFIIISFCTLFFLILGDPWHDFDNAEELSFGDSLYFMFITITTVSIAMITFLSIY